MKFQIKGPIRQEKTFSTGSGIREIARLRRVYGKGRWRKRKGIAEIEFENGIRAGAARECFEADLFIKMPKLKTHFEVGMSVCLKNLMGCLVGQQNKKENA